MLESADLEFNRLTVEIEEYAKQLNESIQQDELDYELTSIGLEVLLLDKYNYYIDHGRKLLNDNNIHLAIEELNQFGINDLKG